MKKTVIPSYLTEDDFFHDEETGKTLCLKSGIKKIIFNEKLEVRTTITHANVYNYHDHSGKIHTAMFAVAESRALNLKDHNVVTEIGSAYHRNCTYNYEAEVAAKRAESRAVLAVIGLTQENWIGEDEVNTTEKESKTSVDHLLANLEKKAGRGSKFSKD
jgi:hypothetical protein